MKIYTKRGDQGKTSLRHGERVAKDDIRIETNGQIDELNALLGIVVALMPADNPEWERLHNLQLLLMKIMGMIADSSNVLPSEDKSFSSMIVDLEHYIDENTSKDRFWQHSGSLHAQKRGLVNAECGLCVVITLWMTR